MSQSNSTQLTESFTVHTHTLSLLSPVLKSGKFVSLKSVSYLKWPPPYHLLPLHPNLAITHLCDSKVTFLPSFHCKFCVCLFLSVSRSVLFVWEQCWNGFYAASVFNYGQQAVPTTPVPAKPAPTPLEKPSPKPSPKPPQGLSHKAFTCTFAITLTSQCTKALCQHPPERFLFFSLPPEIRALRRVLRPPIHPLRIQDASGPAQALLHGLSPHPCRRGGSHTINPVRYEG